MQTNFKEGLCHVLINEGGWADHPSDPGGATMRGVTLDTFRKFYGQGRTKDDLRNISSTQLTHIYKVGYWDRIKGDWLPAGIDFAVFDAAVNSGVSRGSKWLQAALDVKQDGCIGPNTLARASLVASLYGPDTVIEDICRRRLAFLKGLGTWSVFGKGWERRVSSVRITAKDMIERI